MKSVQEYSDMLDTREIRGKDDLDAVLKSAWNLMLTLLRHATEGAERNNEQAFSNLDRSSGIWKSVCAKHPDILRPEGFRLFVECHMPDVYEEWTGRKSRDLLRLKTQGR